MPVSRFQRSNDSGDVQHEIWNIDWPQVMVTSSDVIEEQPFIRGQRRSYWDQHRSWCGRGQWEDISGTFSTRLHLFPPSKILDT